ncbi:uncharacterized protein LOC144452945 isoform X2 [Glandiceps talaboti]
MAKVTITLLLICVAIVQVYSSLDLSPADRMALRSLLLQDAYNYGTREDENTNSNELHIPAFTYISGGAGEGKQQLGPANIPNAQMAVPEIDSQKYEVPPNPCVPGRQIQGNQVVRSNLFPGLKCSCNSTWNEGMDIQTDCVDPASVGCCIMNMEDNENFVEYFQSEQGKDSDDGIANVQKVYKKNSYDSTDRFARRANRYLDGQDRINSVVAKKSPRYLDPNGTFM